MATTEDTHLKCLVLGAGGQVGTALRRLLDPRAATFATRDDLDLTNLETIAPFVRAQRPWVVINCAAYTAVDEAEEESEAANIVNGFAVGGLAEVTVDLDIPLVTYSSNYVFDGTKRDPYVESDAVAPINAYGRSKRIGEELALGANPRALVIRSSWLISATHPNFVATILGAAAGDGAYVVDDQHGRPTIADDLATATLEAIDKDATGILHLTNTGTTTWFGLAQEAAALAGLDPDRIQPSTTDDFPRPAPRPANSALDSERLTTLGLTPLPHYTASLPRVVEALAGIGSWVGG